MDLMDDLGFVLEAEQKRSCGIASQRKRCFWCAAYGLWKKPDISAGCFGKKQSSQLAKWFSRTVNKIDMPNTTPTVRAISTFAVYFRSFDLFVTYILVMKGISYCDVRRKLEPLDRAKANFKRSWFPLLSACCFVEFDTSIICHVLVYCFGSFLSHDCF